MSTKKNLDKLVETGENLLKKPVSRVNLVLGLFEPIEKYGTNEDALKWYRNNYNEHHNTIYFISIFFVLMIIFS